MRNWTRCLILSNHMLPLFAHLDHNNYESIWILITCSDWYDIISLHIPSSKDLNNFLVLHIHWLPALLTQVPWKIKRNPKIKRELQPEDQTLQLLHPIDFLPSLRACPRKDAAIWSRLNHHANIHANIRLFLGFYIASTKRSNLYSSSLASTSVEMRQKQILKRREFTSSELWWIHGFERKSSQMRGEGLGGICVSLCLWAVGTKCEVDVMFIRWRLCLWAVGTECVGCSEMRVSALLRAGSA